MPLASATIGLTPIYFVASRSARTGEQLASYHGIALALVVTNRGEIGLFEWVIEVAFGPQV